MRYITFSITWPASRQIYSNRKKILHSKKVQLPRDWFGTPTWRHGGHIGVPIQWNGGYWRLCSKQILWELISFLMQTFFFVPPNLHKSWLKLKRSGLMFPRFMAQTFTVYWSWLASIKYSVQSACFNIRAYSNSLKPKDHKRILP